FSGDEKYRNCRQRVEQAVDGQQHPGRGGGVNTEKLEYTADQIGIERRLPSRRAGGIAIRIGEALTQRDGSSDTAHFPAKGEMVFRRAEAVLMEDTDCCDLKGQRYEHHPQQRPADCLRRCSRGWRREWWSCAQR